MLTQMVNAAENFDELQVEAEKLPNGKQGISYGLPAHVLDATNLLKSYWDELPAETVSVRFGQKFWPNQTFFFIGFGHWPNNIFFFVGFGHWPNHTISKYCIRPSNYFFYFFGHVFF
jgi:hypothetical protein